MALGIAISVGFLALKICMIKKHMFDNESTDLRNVNPDPSGKRMVTLSPALPLLETRPWSRLAPIPLAAALGVSPGSKECWALLPRVVLRVLRPLQGNASTQTLSSQLVSFDSKTHHRLTPPFSQDMQKGRLGQGEEKPQHSGASRDASVANCVRGLTGHRSSLTIDFVSL
ncbi:hypothetical protein HPG69_015420 [Diceros bicornis minor]|uniref:Uncharacterized protein n=1 Tax=Diceros bicornis minor TaxID=77932 RepID=A0A7J7F1R1_DICBM|nr:hypothetical protein HPG69_015420 [Diceros bicornis minor]